MASSTTTPKESQAIRTPRESEAARILRIEIIEAALVVIGALKHDQGTDTIGNFAGYYPPDSAEAADLERAITLLPALTPARKSEFTIRQAKAAWVRQLRHARRTL